MSAICGIVRFDGKPVESDELETMVESSPYRGPDGSGYHIDKNAGFAHMAFHVTPESVHEKQPLVSEDDRYVLVADARLDNRDELFKKLEIRPDPERVITDPELILLSWRKWGKACAGHLLGDFVFSVWDKREQLLSDPLIVQQNWLDSEWLSRQVQAAEMWSGAGFPLSNCLHLELWLRAIKPSLLNEKGWSVAEPPLF